MVRNEYGMPDDTPTKRRYVVAAEELRRVRAAIHPFVDRFEGWNMRAAKGAGAIMSHAQNEAEKLVHRTDMQALQREISEAHSEFVSATIELPRHSRIDDIEAAFQRLLRILADLPRK